MHIDQPHFRHILLDLIDSSPLACRGVLGVCDLEFTGQVSSLAVTLTRPAVLKVNLEFVRAHCQTETHVKALLIHEFLHVLLRHTERLKRMTPALNLALDAAINAIIHRNLGPDWSDFMSRYYQDCPGPLRLLRPIQPTDREVHNATKRKRRTRRQKRLADEFMRVWQGIYNGFLLAEDVFDYCRQIETDHIRQLLANGTVLLGNHDESAPSIDLDDLDPEIADQLRQCLQSLHGAGVRWNRKRRGGLWDRQAALDDHHKLVAWRPTAWAAIRECLLPDRVARSRWIGSGEIHLPILTSADRRGAVRSLWNPLLPDCTWPVSVPRARGRAQVYLDVSGSMEAEIRRLLGLLIEFLPLIRLPLWAFSTKVEPARIEDGRLLTHSTGGTSINAVLDHVVETRPERALIITDGWVEPCEPWLLWKLKPDTIRALIVSGGNATRLESDGIPCRKLDPQMMSEMKTRSAWVAGCRIGSASGSSTRASCGLRRSSLQSARCWPVRLMSVPTRRTRASMIRATPVKISPPTMPAL